MRVYVCVETNVHAPAQRHKNKEQGRTGDQGRGSIDLDLIRMARVIFIQQLKRDGMRAHDILAAWVWACDDLDVDSARAGSEALG